CFTLKNSKKYFFDQVVLFAGNINYNEETGEVYNKNNENVTQLLNYKEKYLAPLRAKGIKVIMGILGNWDRAALTNLTEEGAKAFARHMKAMCDAYDLDGVFLDDEYS
ncbi:chitinase, partial [Brevibacterium sp. UMB10442]|nr:chitinase [Brevibacterium sp. UMB10442]